MLTAKNALYTYEIMRTRTKEKKIEVCAPSDAYEYAKNIYQMDSIDYELMVALMLNPKNDVIGTYIIARGLVDRANCHAREVFRVAISLACSKIIIVHNHPSGNSTPSRQDITCTKDLAKAGKIIGIKVVDHIIIGENEKFSFAENDLMED